MRHWLEWLFLLPIAGSFIVTMSRQGTGPGSGGSGDGLLIEVGSDKFFLKIDDTFFLKID